MKNAAQVILAPIITEKTTGLKDASRILCFKVAKKAKKIEIRSAVEKLFKVKVSQVRTLTVHGKWKRLGRYAGRRPDWKKAYVTLAEGQKMIEYFEGT
ncbi:MAG TPA: 50S ribosomal protein L23 [Candidatus Polarisedimenticolia bacterium]|nr:50S ribosomal protein L23 [Candidatus Polarisedimenticolia bacterium]